MYAPLSRVLLRNSSTNRRSSGVSKCPNMKQIYDFIADRSKPLCFGYNVEPLIIINNVFTGGNNGVHQNGNGLLYVENNRLSGHLTAVELYEGGTQYNHVTNNEIQSSFLGAHSVLPNSGLRYLDNCFSANQLVDIFISDGDIFTWQGSPALAAGNCFTKFGRPEIDNDAGTAPVFYYVKTGTPTNSCKFPVNLQNVTLAPNAANENPTDCGPEFLGGEGDHYCNFNEELPIGQLKQQRIALIQELGSISSGSQSLAAKTLERCIETLESIIGQKMLDPASDDPDAGKENAIAFYTSPFMDFKDKTSAYGIMVHNGELVRAGNFLNALITQTQEQSDFVAVQKINLDYLAQPAEYELSEPNRNYLYSVGNSDGAFNGYARSLYEVLTGERIEVEIPSLGIEERNSGASPNPVPPLISVYPNPSRTGAFNLQIGHLVQNAAYSASVIDATGRIRHTITIAADGVYEIGSEHLPSGLYFLSIRDDSNAAIFQSKLVILH